jgi:hypothetical protein
MSNKFVLAFVPIDQDMRHFKCYLHDLITSTVSTDLKEAKYLDKSEADEAFVREQCHPTWTKVIERVDEV